MTTKLKPEIICPLCGTKIKGVYKKGDKLTEYSCEGTFKEGNRQCSVYITIPGNMTGVED